jgi:hypothetical protein
VEFACGIPHLLKGGFSENVSSKVDAYSILQPVGVVAGITPFNFPAMVPMWMFPVAIACGNTFVLKPSEKDPSASIRIAELWAEAGLPEGVFNVLQGDKALSWYARVWGYVQDVAVGYGYRPMRAAGWLVVLLVIGTVTFGLHHPPPMELGKGPHFNAFVYTLNLLLPIVDFGQAKAFNPQGLYQWLSYLLIAVGWILATTIVAGVSRAISRQ